jgi:hypothetical protein
MYTGHLEPLWIGRTWVGVFKLTYKDDDGVNQPIPQSELDAVTFKGGIYRSNCGSPIVSAETGNGILTVADGVIQWRIESAVTAGLSAGQHVIKIDVTDGNEIDPLFETNLPVRC